MSQQLKKSLPQLVSFKISIAFAFCLTYVVVQNIETLNFTTETKNFYCLYVIFLNETFIYVIRYYLLYLVILKRIVEYMLDSINENKD